MAGLLLEILLDESLDAGTVGGAIDEALAAADLGEVAGTWDSAGLTAIDVELDDEAHVDEATLLIRRVLKGLAVPGATPIYRCDEVAEVEARPEPEPERAVFESAALFDPSWSRYQVYYGYGYGRAAS